MARLFQSGFELNSQTAGVEWTATNGSPTIDTGTVRTGTYAGKSIASSGAPTGWLYQFKSAANAGPFYARVGFRYSALPAASTVIFCFSNAIIFSNVQAADPAIKINSDGSLALFNNTQVGSNSAVMASNTWHYIELWFDSSPAGGSEVMKARLNGTEFASASNLTVNGDVRALLLGSNVFFEAQASGTYFFDDIAVNDNTGSFQTTYPGDGKILHLKPSAAGDANGFLTQVGGTAGSTNNFTRVNEIPPDDATTYNASAILSAEDLFNCDDSGIATADTVSVVAVGVRMADLVGADATAAFKVEVEKTASGTKSQSAAIIPNSTTWLTNTAAAPRNYPLVTYQDPDAANWTKTTLDSMQIGYITTAANVQAMAVSNVWASVDYKQAAAVLSSARRMLQGMGL